MATYSYDEKTNREDLTDVIVNISPTETPIQSMIGKTKAHGTYHEFPEDELAEAAKNAHVEGEAFKPAEVGSRARKGNHTQIFQKGFTVTETQQAVDKAGVSDEYAYQQLKAMKEIAKDLEFALVNNATDKAGSKTEAREMAGIPGLVKTNAISATAINSTAVNDALEACWKAGGEPNKLIVSGKNKRAISAMTTSNTRNVNAKDKSLVEAVDVYDSDFGRVEVKASRFMPDDKIFVLDPSYLKLAWLRNFKKVDLPPTADGKSGVIVGEVTLELKGEKGQAIITLAGK